MAALPLETWARLALWLALGFVVYFAYGARRAARVRAEGRRDTGPGFDAGGH
jgi:APA family basic amino acid/polyamine antiporter